MSKKARYLLLVFGFLVFIVLAPMIVMYATGLRYDTASGRFTPTGLIAIRTDPRSASITVNGKPRLKSAGDIKFLEPGEYEISIKRDGYFEWSKRLQVKENQVTWANPVPNKIFLFRKDQQPQQLASNITDFSIIGSQVLAVTNGGLSLFSLNTPQASENYPLSEPVDTILAVQGDQAVVGQSSSTNPALYYFNRSDRKTTDLSSLFSSKPTVKIASDGTLFALDQGSLYRLNPTARTKQLITTHCSAYALEGHNLYYTTDVDSKNTLYVAGLDGHNPQVLFENIPSFLSGDIFITSQKQAFLKADNKLYVIRLGLDLLSDNVDEVDFNQEAGTLLFHHGGEVSNYNFGQQNVDLVTRSDERLASPILDQPTSVAFVIKGNRAEGIELDPRDRQNEYVFYEGKNLTKISLYRQSTALLVLDGGTLQEIKIR